MLLGIITSAIIRLTREPKKLGRESRFYGSHTGGAWLIGREPGRYTMENVLGL